MRQNNRSVRRISGFSNKLNILTEKAFKVAELRGEMELDSYSFLLTMISTSCSNMNLLMQKLNTEMSIDSFTNIIMTDYKEECSSTDEIEDIDGLATEFYDIIIDLQSRLSYETDCITAEILIDKMIHTKECEAYIKLEELKLLDSNKIQNNRANIKYTKYLKQFAKVLNEEVISREYEPITNRDDIIGQVIDTLGRKNKCNPFIIGEAGVGKTSIVKALARKIEEGSVPENLKEHNILEIDIAKVLSGTKYRGDFEERFTNILKETMEIGNTILFFDEAHMLFKAGDNQETGTTAINMLKPELTGGKLKIIGATTIEEFRKTIEEDAAFERRIQEIMLREPSLEEAEQMIQNQIEVYSDFHKCIFSQGSIKSAVALSARYIYNKRLPDKAITVLDQTASRIKSKGARNFIVDERDIRETISKITGVNIVELGDDENKKLRMLGKKLKVNIIGQDTAIDSVVKAIKRGRTGISDPRKPIGTFLFVGPTGVGKTEICKQLAKELNGDIDSLIKFDMSEYKEEHTISRLIGAPPGYIGHESAGLLTESVKRNPYSIILLDEIEKANESIFNLLLQVLDDGILTDAKGNKVEFRNCIIVMTSNAGYGLKETKTVGFEAQNKIIKQTDTKMALEKTFRPEFINRIDSVITFNALGMEDIVEITRLMLKDLANRIECSSITWGDNLVNKIAECGYSEKYGARNVKRYITSMVEDEIADRIIEEGVKEKDISVDFNNDTQLLQIDITGKIDTVKPLELSGGIKI